jgi:hypothetical protein
VPLAVDLLLTLQSVFMPTLQSVLLPTSLQSGFLPTPQSVFMPLMVDFHSSALSLMLLVFVLSLDRHLGSLGIELIFLAWFCFNRIGCIIWVLSLSFVVITDRLSLDWTLVLGAILVFLVCCHLYRWASSFIVLGYVKIINILNFGFNYAMFLLLFLPVGFSFPSPITPGSLTSPSSHLFLSNLVVVAVPALMAGCIVLTNIIVLL